MDYKAIGIGLASAPSQPPTWVGAFLDVFSNLKIFFNKARSGSNPDTNAERICVVYWIARKNRIQTAGTAPRLFCMYIAMDEFGRWWVFTEEDEPLSGPYDTPEDALESYLDAAL